MKNIIFLLLFLFALDAKSQCSYRPRYRHCTTTYYRPAYTHIVYYESRPVQVIRYVEPPPQVIYVERVIEEPPPPKVIYREKIVYVEKRVKEPSSHTITVSEKNGPTLISVTVLD